MSEDDVVATRSPRLYLAFGPSSSERDSARGRQPGPRGEVSNIRKPKFRQESVEESALRRDALAHEIRVSATRPRTFEALLETRPRSFEDQEELRLVGRKIASRTRNGGAPSALPPSRGR